MNETEKIFSKSIKKDNLLLIKIRGCTNNSRPFTSEVKIDTAMALYNNKPELTVTSICKIVGISKSTLYKYRGRLLKNKEEKLDILS